MGELPVSKTDEYYEDMGSYMMRVSGLGTAEALFMRHAQNESEARFEMETWLSIDKRVTRSRLFKITCLDKEPAAAFVQEKSTAVYLLTGLTKVGTKKHLINSFFMEQSIARAKEHMLLRGLEESRLYLCKPL